MAASFANVAAPKQIEFAYTVTGAEDIGTCNNVWALDCYKKQYTITQNVDGSYHLSVDYKDGKFVTTAGSNPYGGRADATPGAGEGETDNGVQSAPHRPGSALPSLLSWLPITQA